MQTHNLALQELLDTVVKPNLSDNEFTEPHHLIHVWLDHEQAVGGTTLGKFALRRDHKFFMDEINGIFADDRWTNLDQPGKLPSDTYRFFVDSMCLMFHCTYEPFYRLLYQARLQLNIAKQEFTPWLRGIQLPQGSGITGYSPNTAYLNNGLATSMAIFEFPQVIEIEQQVDQFEVLCHWDRYFQGESEVGSDPVTLINSWLQANLGQLDVAGNIFFGVRIDGVRVRRVS